MISVNTYNQKGEKIGKTSLNPKVFGINPKSNLVTQVVNAYLTNQRKAMAKTKTKAEVRGGGRKPWRQKGTGRARAGSIRSPIWRGGGIIFGPTGKENYTKQIPSKIKKLALLSVLSNKVQTNNLILLDIIEFKNIKTKDAQVMFQNLPAKSGTFLFMTEKSNKNIDLSMLTILVDSPGTLR